VGACRATGVDACQNGSVTPVCVPGTPAPNDGSCNGVDDDCDGQFDEEYAGVTSQCGVGACTRSGVTTCVAGNVQADCQPGTPGVNDVSCDGVDDDCSGQADEDYVSVPTTCGAGACSATGTTRCEGGQVRDSCSAGGGSGSDAVCNGIDDDCDGQVDEDFVPQTLSCGIGACAAQGSSACEGGSVVNRCTPLAPAADDATCDGIDDDCDGRTDEDFVAVPPVCGLGACRRTGTQACELGAIEESCTPAAPAASDAVCNDIDDDCDGPVDEDYVPATSQCGVGACRATGTTRCEAGSVVPVCAPGTPAASDATCDGRDDDCDGTNDEDFVGEATACGAGVCASAGQIQCVNGSPVDDCAPGIPAPNDATCDGADQDCDGGIDEDFAPSATSCGLGACRREGVRRCSAGELEDTCRPGSPASNDSTCDGVDEDCNGTNDEDFAISALQCGTGVCAAQGSTACRNGQIVSSCQPGVPTGSDNDCDGLDDDCDGTADEAFVVACSGPAVQRCVGGVLQSSVCSDDNACNGSESCVAAACVAGMPPALSDGDPCTLDLCDPSSGVSHPFAPRGTTCGAGRACDGQGACASLPVITEQPAGATVNAGEPLSFAVSATGIGLSYQWKRFGVAIAGATQPTYSIAQVDPADEGAEFSVVVSNAAGSVVSAVAVVRITDGSGPTLSVEGSLDRSVDQDLITLTGSVQDAGSGIAAISLHSNRFATPLAVVAAPGTGVFSVEVPLLVGVNLLTLRAVDRQNNQSQVALTVTLQVSGLPRLSITSPAPGTTTAAGLVDVAGVVRACVPPESIRLTLGGDVVFPTGTNGDYTFVFRKVHLNPGSNALTVTATTIQGSVTAQVVIVRRESAAPGGTPPVIRVAGALGELYVAANSQAVSGTVSAEACVSSVTVNGAPAAITGAGSEVTFDATINLAGTSERVPVTIVAQDCASRESELKYTIIHDSVAPVIQSVLARGLHNVSVTPYLISGTITDPNLAGVSANQESVGVLPGADGAWDFNFSVPLVRGADRPVRIEAWDRAGNRAGYELVLRFEASRDIELIAPSPGTELLSAQPSSSISVVARVEGALPSWVLDARVDGGPAQRLTPTGSTYQGTVAVSGFGVHQLLVELIDDTGVRHAAAQASFSVKDQSSVPLRISLQEPLNGAQNLEANQVVVLAFNRPIDASLLKIELFETVHGKAYRAPGSGAGLAQFTSVELVDVHRENALVPGGVSFMPGDQLVAFYPAREFGYGASVEVKVSYDETEALRGRFQIRPLPTLISGFIADQFFNPLDGLRVALDDGRVTTTNREGAFSFGFGAFADRLPPGRRRLVVNPGMKDPRYGSAEQFVYTEAGRVADLGVLRTPLLSPNEPFRHVTSRASSVPLLGGQLVLELTDAEVTFPNGASAGDVHAQVLVAAEAAYPTRPSAIPAFTYGIQPIGIEVNGSVRLDLAVPEEVGPTYFDSLAERVLLVGLDPNALELVPIGVGRVDRSARRIRSEGPLAPRRLDFIGVSPQRNPAIQTLLARYGSETMTLQELVAALEAGR
jgi:hypothetical protein